MKEGVLLLSHGSRRSEANDEILAIGSRVQERDPQGVYRVAFMSFGNPDIGESIDNLVSSGTDRIIVMPLFLVTGNHISLDIPEELEKHQQRLPGVEFVMAQHLAGHPGLIDIVMERIQACSIR